MRVAGADVWEGRWVVVTLLDGEFEDVRVVATLGEYLERRPKVKALGVDMPVDLATRSAQRACDAQARAMVGARSSSVFSPPMLEVIGITHYADANAAARELSRAGISKQAHALGAKIREVRALRAEFPRVHEVHPEVSFVAANRGRPLAWSKHTWNGVEERRRILKRVGLVPPGPDAAALNAGVDDVLDATIVAWSAHRVATKASGRLPESDDGTGLIEY